MTRFKNNSALLFGLLLSTVSIAQQASERTLVKSFNLQGNETVVLDFEGAVEVQTWSNSTVRVQMNIKVNNRPDSFLKSMITAGRYNLDAMEGDQGITISAPGMERKVKLRGAELQESLSYLVFAPEHVQVVLSNEATSNLEDTIEDTRIK